MIKQIKQPPRPRLSTLTAPRYWQSRAIIKSVIVAMSRFWKKMAWYQRSALMGLRERHGRGGHHGKKVHWPPPFRFNFKHSFT